MEEEWPIEQVARMSGVTARALRHYDAVGLLAPARTGAGGRRLYGRAELRRLQEILLLRELGLGLTAVAEVLATGRPAGAVDALRLHHARLLAERDRLDTLAATVAATIDDLEGGTAMTAEKMFDGFATNPYEAEARERWGDEVVDASTARAAGLTADEAGRIQDTFTRVHTELGALRAAGVPVDDERVQALVAEHHGVVATFWTPDAQAYAGLGRMYVEDDRFRRSIGRGDDAVVEYLRDAMAVYAGTALS